VTSHEELLAGLNPAQRDAVLHVDGPLLVIAGAGSGKTRVLTHRVAHLIRAHGVKPDEILAITFTNKAAGEMRERLERMLGRVSRAIWILTFHSACGRILRAEAPRLGYKPSFTIIDQADQVRLVKACIEELGKDPKRFTPRGIHTQISNAKNQLVSPAVYASRVGSFWDQTVAEVYELYQRRLFGANAVDFDDMLMLTVDVLERFPEARERVPPHPRRRVPGHEPRPVSTAPDPGGGPWQRVRSRRPGSVPGRGNHGDDGRRHRAPDRGGACR
jgi:DNA helicase-2/ATP-dependent DNA helicase PcrA